jgi:hypothetical protein
MPQLYLIVAVLSLLLGKLKDIFASIQLSDDVKKIIKYALIGLLIYYVYRIITHYVNKQKALGEDNGQLAIELHNAIFPNGGDIHIPLFGEYNWDNTDEEAVLGISLKIKDINQVSAFYKDLFRGNDLYRDLASGLNPEELAKFNENIKNVKDGNLEDIGDKTSNALPVLTNQTPLPPNVAVKTRLYCRSKSKVNVRSSIDPTKILYTVDYKTFDDYETGYVGDLVKYRTEKIKGKMIDFVQVDIPWYHQDLRYGLDGLIAKSYLTTVKPKQ